MEAPARLIGLLGPLGIGRSERIPRPRTPTESFLPKEIRGLFGFSLDPAREALLRSSVLQVRYGSRVWLDSVRLHPAARQPAGVPFGARA